MSSKTPVSSPDKQDQSALTSKGTAAKEKVERSSSVSPKKAQGPQDDNSSETASGNTKKAKESEKNTIPTSEGATKKSEVCVEKTVTSTDLKVTCKTSPIVKDSNSGAPTRVAVPRQKPPPFVPLVNERPLVLATHLVPSLPVSLFEAVQEAIEVATGKPVVLLYEPRTDRPVAKSVTDIAILPASENWEDGRLMPVSFCFDHHLNKDRSPGVYADVIVAGDRARHVQDIIDLRGHRCSLPDRRRQIGAATLLFDHLRTRGESPAFFGNTLDVNSQVATLQMVAGKQAELGILESPVIKCHKNSLPGVEFVHILTSLGPLPPYKLMANKSLPDALVRKITAYLLNIEQDKEWLERFEAFGLIGFSENSSDLYAVENSKSVVTSVPYY